VDHSGCIDAWELKEAMKSLGQVIETQKARLSLSALLRTVSTCTRLAYRALFRPLHNTLRDHL